MNLVMVDARHRFLARLAGVEDPEQKRKIIGDEFIRVFEEEAANLGRIDFLTQGTLYPDVIESATSETKAAQKIKTHHNVGGLPADLRFKLIEPLRYLFKDEVRKVGVQLGLPEAMVLRHRSPAPGWRSASSGRSRPSASTRCARPTGSSSTRSRPPGSTASSGSRSRSSRRSAASASWATGAPTPTSSRSGR